MDRPLILSTGMSTLEEIHEAVEVIRDQRERAGLAQPLQSILTILHCTSNYPAAIDDINLRALGTMASSIGVPVGYSDHSLGVAVSTAAVALGATVIEKHFTLDNRLPGPDHRASLVPTELAAMIEQIRNVERALGSSIKRPSDAELPVRELVRRSVTAAANLRAGVPVLAADLCLLRPGTGIPPRELGAVVGRSPVRDIAGGSTLSWADFL
jgi:N,N'-diacetyllegionaminate synthase